MGKKVIKYKGEPQKSIDEVRIREIGEKMRAEEEARRKADERARRKAETIELLKILASGFAVAFFAAHVIIAEWYFIFR